MSRQAREIRVTSIQVPTPEEAVALATTPVALDLILEAYAWHRRRHADDDTRAQPADRPEAA